MHATVMSWVGLPVRNTRRKTSVSPHIPGRRRPQVRHSSASARVRRPQEGHRIVRVGLPNIVKGLAGRRVAFIEPHTEIDETTGARAEGTRDIADPRGTTTACGATETASLRRPVGVARGRGSRLAHDRSLGLGGHLERIVLIRRKTCQRDDFPGVSRISTKTSPLTRSGGSHTLSRVRPLPGGSVTRANAIEFTHRQGASDA